MPPRDRRPRRGGVSHRRRIARARSSPAALRPAATTRAAPSNFAVCTATMPDRARRAQDEHVLAASQRRPPRERQPAGETCDPERGCERRIRAVGHLDRMRVARSARARRSRRATSARATRRRSRPHGRRRSDPPPRSQGRTAAPGDRWRGCRARRRGRSGLIGAASTSTDSPEGSATSPTSGAPPTSRMSAALTRPRRSPRSPPSCRAAGCRRRPRSEHGPRRTPRRRGRNSR